MELLFDPDCSVVGAINIVLIEIKCSKRTVEQKKTKPKIAPSPAFEPRPPDSVARFVSRSLVSHDS
jgi:hypothetical protein